MSTDDDWVSGQVDTQILHVYPTGDLIEHATNDSHGDCVCGPRLEPVHELDGSPGGLLLVHHSLDGREQQEPQ